MTEAASARYLAACTAGLRAIAERCAARCLQSSRRTGMAGQPAGHLDVPLRPGTPLENALNGSLLANFVNTVQLDASGADISACSLPNEFKGWKGCHGARCGFYVCLCQHAQGVAHYRSRPARLCGAHSVLLLWWITVRFSSTAAFCARRLSIIIMIISPVWIILSTCAVL